MYCNLHRTNKGNNFKGIQVPDSVIRGLSLSNNVSPCVGCNSTPGSSYLDHKKNKDVKVLQFFIEPSVDLHHQEDKDNNNQPPNQDNSKLDALDLGQDSGENNQLPNGGNSKLDASNSDQNDGENNQPPNGDNSKLDASINSCDDVDNNNKNVQVVNWLELPSHLTFVIAEKLFYNVKDLIQFGAVCMSWQSVFIEIRKDRHRLPRQLPLLLLRTEFNSDDQTRSCYSLTEDRVSNFQFRVPHDWHCQSSSHGWLVIVRNNLDVFLFNPFLSVNNEIQLPPITAFTRDPRELVFHNDYITKAVLSANPILNPNYVVMVIHGGCRLLAFWRPGDKAWTSLDSKYTVVMDIIYFKEQFYVVTHFGEVLAFDLNHPYPKVSVISPKPTDYSLTSQSKYLVVSSGDLLQVSRRRTGTGGYFYTRRFELFKLDTTRTEWVEVKSLGGRILLLGDNTSLSLSASEFPKCKSNSIYFTDDFHEAYGSRVYQMESDGPVPHDIGVFDLEDGSVQPLFPMQSEMMIPPPIWIEPTL